MEIKKLFDDNFDFAFKATTYNNMKVAIQSFEQFKKNNEDFFSFDKRETLFGYLLTYAIEKQFNDSAFNPKANYAVSMKQVNNYKYKALCIETNDFIVNVGRTNGEFKLLPVSAYKKELAKANNGLSMQLYRYGEMTHLNIVLPSGDYKTIEYSTNLLENISIYENYIPQDLVEESIVSLKKSISKEIEKII